MMELIEQSNNLRIFKGHTIFRRYLFIFALFIDFYGIERKNRYCC